MKAAKVKSRKQKARLQGRIDEFERIPDKKAYTKPGSNKK